MTEREQAIEAVNDMELTDGATSRDLTPEQRAALKAVINKESVFITGPGGTGKSYLITLIAEHFRDDCQIVCPTWQSAEVHKDYKAVTLHTFFKFRVPNDLYSDIDERDLSDQAKKEKHEAMPKFSGPN